MSKLVDLYEATLAHYMAGSAVIGGLAGLASNGKDKMYKGAKLGLVGYGAGAGLGALNTNPIGGKADSMHWNGIAIQGGALVGYLAGLSVRALVLWLEKKLNRKPTEAEVKDFKEKIQELKKGD